MHYEEYSHCFMPFVASKHYPGHFGPAFNAFRVTWLGLLGGGEHKPVALRQQFFIQMSAFAPVFSAVVRCFSVFSAPSGCFMMISVA